MNTFDRDYCSITTSRDFLRNKLFGTKCLADLQNNQFTADMAVLQPKQVHLHHEVMNSPTIAKELTVSTLNDNH